MHKKLDIIGDIHGNADALQRLLEKMGYRRTNGTFHHPEGRHAIFTGDYVDTGDQNLLVVETVQAMVESGSADAVMGNHDFNIVAFNRHPKGRPDKYLRSRSPNHIRQCLTTQAEIEADPDRGRRALEFLESLPLWLNIPGARVVHAYWDTNAMAILRPLLNDDHVLTYEGFEAASAPSGTFGDARAQLLSGPEDECEPYEDRYGCSRSKERRRWWESQSQNAEPPIFFGHYALETPLGIFTNAVCVDGGIARGREIVGYRHSVGSPLNAENYIYA